LRLNLDDITKTRTKLTYNKRMGDMLIY
jgi:hypothetical protein